MFVLDSFIDGKKYMYTYEQKSFIAISILKLSTLPHYELKRNFTSMSSFKHCI